MHDSLLGVLGIVSAVLNIAGAVPYVRDILRHKTRPERATWWIWLGLNLISFFAQLAAGATWSLCFTAAQTLVVLLLAVLSLQYGYGVFRRRDFIALFVAVAGLIVWGFTRQPLTALLIVIAVDTVGYWLTLHKTWQAPHTETLITWILGSASATLGLLSVGDLNFTKLVYPLYVMISNWLLVVVIISRRREHPGHAHDK